MKHFGELVRQKRGERSLFSVGVEADCTPETVRKLERDGKGSLQIALRVAKALGIKSIPVI